jgi:hypothetical protein
VGPYPAGVTSGLIARGTATSVRRWAWQANTCGRAGAAQARSARTPAAAAVCANANVDSNASTPSHARIASSRRGKFPNPIGVEPDKSK